MLSLDNIEIGALELRVEPNCTMPDAREPRVSVKPEAFVLFVERSIRQVPAEVSTHKFYRC